MMAPNPFADPVLEKQALLEVLYSRPAYAPFEEFESLWSRLRNVFKRLLKR